LGNRQRYQQSRITPIRLMQQASVPKNLWAEAVATAVYLSNLTPTKGTESDSATPYELWNDSKPSLKHLRVWGCTAYAYIVKAKRKDAKFGPRAERGVFIGYTFSHTLFSTRIALFTTRSRKSFLSQPHMSPTTPPNLPSKGHASRKSTMSQTARQPLPTHRHQSPRRYIPVSG
jgi:hypothetical protein